MDPTLPVNLRSALRARLLDGMIRKVKPAAGGWKVLVVDREALRILAAAVPLDSLVDEGVTIVEMLDLRREPLPRLPAIYFVSPSPESIQNLACEDKAQYKEFHLFFTSTLPDFQLDVIRQNTAVLRRVKTLVELNINFLVSESIVFSLDRPAASLPQLFGNPSGVSTKDAIAEMSLISERLTDACSLIAPDLPWTLRFDAASTVSRTIASLTKEQLDLNRIDRAARKSSSPADSAVSSSPALAGPSRATLLVIDRATDVISPLMHEFSYQAMAHDLLKLDYRKPGGAHYTSKEPDEKGKPKQIPIDDEEKDPVWDSVRHLFIEAAHDRAQEALRHFLDNDKAYKIVGKDNADVNISDMTAAVRNLADSKMRAERHAMHVSALRDCLNLCSELKLTDIAAAEQDLVIGRHADGTRVRSDEIIDTLRGLVGNEAIPVEHRVRALLVGLAIAAAGSVALGGEASVLVTSAAFRSKLGRSGLAEDLPGLTAELRAAIRGLEQVLGSARHSAEALAARNAPPPARREQRATKAGQMASLVQTRLKERKAYKQHEKATATRRRRQRLDDAEEVPYDVARYIPPARSVVADLVSDALDAAAFPTAGAVDPDSIITQLGGAAPAADDGASSGGEGAPPSSGAGGGGKRPAQPMRALAAGATQAARRTLARSLSRERGAGSEEGEAEGEREPAGADPDHLFVVFFAGGVCFSEVRAVHEVRAKRGANIVVGGSGVLTPQLYLAALGGVADPVLRINVLMPPLPLELAQTRAAAERTRQAGAAIQKRAPPAQETRATRKTGPAKAPPQKQQQQQQPGYDRPQDAEVEVVTGVTKKGFARRLFGRK